MSVAKEFLKSMFLSSIPVVIAIYGSWIFLETGKSKFFSILLITLIAITYLVLLKNDLAQLKNEYERDMGEHQKRWRREVQDTRADLEKRGLTFSGEGVKKLGTMSAYPGQEKGEIEKNRDDYEKYRTRKFKLDFTRAKYIVLAKLFKRGDS